jgi:pimeloyl-ACP methyl ester carboxylesterase
MARSAPVDGVALAYDRRGAGDVTLELLDGVGHFTPVEAPEAFAAAIRRALA